MSSQTDLDQGGTARQWVLADMGPSIGLVQVPLQNVLNITAAGTYALDRSTSLVTVNVPVGGVTITLPTCVQPVEKGAGMAQPALFAQTPITIVDVGGSALTNPITIQRNNSNESVMGLASIQLATNYGGYTLSPNSAQKTWNSISP